jgi:carbamoyltransferase
VSIKIIGISSYYHDSAAALIIDGTVVAAAQEERFTRKKHDPSFPKQSIQFLLKKEEIGLSDIDYVVFYDKPLVKFERLLETYIAFAPRGIRSFLMAMPVWLKEKLFLKETLKRELAALSGLEKEKLPQLMFTEHHQSHAASAFFPSPYKKAAVLCVDGVGEWATTSIWLGDGNKLEARWEIDFPHSLGLLYSAFTYYTGFKVNSGEYKLMGLAPYGEPKYVDLIYKHLIDTKSDGSFRLNMDYFDYATGLTMTNARFDKLFGAPRRESESEITQREMDLARSVQVVTEEMILRISQTIKDRLDVDHLCLAGGVALNCVANGKLLREVIFDDIWIQPAAGDAGGAIGAALSIWHEYLGNERNPDGKTDSTRGSYLGPSFSTSEITGYLDSVDAKYEIVEDAELYPKLAEILNSENVVGWFQGAMEFGPRALGGRSILGDPRSLTMQSTMNLKIKYRESFRPFAPSVKAESVSDWFDMEGASPYMLLVANVKKEKQISMNKEQQKLFGIEKLNIPRSQIPAITHVDYSARVQTVHQETNPRYWNLLDHFERLTGCPVLINTSFNVRGEPIVCTPEDAYRCFMRTEMDYLVLEDVLLAKVDQPQHEQDDTWKNEFELD